MKALMIVSLALVLPLHAATAANTGAEAAPRAVAGQKIDSGLGDLPHYRLWADPSGKNPVAQPQAARAAKVQARSDAKVPRGADAPPAASASTQVAGLK